MVLGALSRQAIVLLRNIHPPACFSIIVLGCLCYLSLPRRAVGWFSLCLWYYSHTHLRFECQRVKLIMDYIPILSLFRPSCSMRRQMSTSSSASPGRSMMTSLLLVTTSLLPRASYSSTSARNNAHTLLVIMVYCEVYRRIHERLTGCQECIKLAYSSFRKILMIFYIK